MTGSKWQVTELSEMFSASLVVGSEDQAACGRVWSRQHEQAFRSGDILLAESDEVRRIVFVDRPIALFTVFWPRAALEHAARELGLRGGPQWALTQLAAGPLSAELALLHGLLESGSDPEAVEQAYRSVTLGLLRSANQGPPVRRSACHPGVRRAAKRVRATFAESPSLEELANELQMSKCHLARCFERSLGVPPHRYRRLLRLRVARRLLEAGLSVGDAASDTGFADAPHLTRAFRDWLGVSPAAWGTAWRAGDPWSKLAPQTMPPPKLG